MIARYVAAALVVVLAVAAASADDSAVARSNEAWAALVAGGHVALIRHANAPPGHGGDPPGWRIGECATQRNLDDVGRRQASALGEALRGRGVRVDQILSSPFCRCLDTARLMNVGAVETSWSLLPDQTSTARPRLAQLKGLVSTWTGPGTLVLVGHGLTVQPLLGLVPEQAEVIVLRPAPGDGVGAHVVGRIPPPR